MYPKFIEVHAQKTGKEIFINVANISVITPLEDGYDYRRIYTNDNDYTDVTESYDELKNLITDVGCLIHKKDPRLDLTHPLTMEDLKDMIGEPVWNSNVNVWMLVKDVTDIWVKMLWTSGNISEYTEDELAKYPLYRMRRD